jgi:hypothetical protein
LRLRRSSALRWRRCAQTLAQRPPGFVFSMGRRQTESIWRHVFVELVRTGMVGQRFEKVIASEPRGHLP